MYHLIIVNKHFSTTFQCLICFCFWFFFFFLIPGVFFDATGSFALSFNILVAVSLLTTVSLGLGDIWEGTRKNERD